MPNTNLLEIINSEDMLLINPIENGVQNYYRIKFNPSINNFKYTVMESVTNTLGSKYPFVRRNGATNYRQFTIGGLISYRSEQDNGSNQQNLSNANSVMSGPALETSATSTDTRTEFEKESEYRNKFMAFLNDSSIKVFHSEAEGNILIKLSNISFTPNQQLGRMIWSWSATATEIDEYTEDNLKKYGFITADNGGTT